MPRGAPLSLRGSSGQIGGGSWPMNWNSASMAAVFISILRSRTPCRARGRGGCGRRGRDGNGGTSSFLLRAFPAHQPPTGADVDVVVLVVVRADRLHRSLLSWVLGGGCSGAVVSGSAVVFHAPINGH